MMSYNQIGYLPGLGTWIHSLNPESQFRKSSPGHLSESLLTCIKVLEIHLDSGNCPQEADNNLVQYCVIMTSYPSPFI